MTTKKESKAEKTQRPEEKKHDQKSDHTTGDHTKSDHQSKIDDLTDQLKRTLAEFDNFRKRQQLESCQRMLFSAKDILQKMLPVKDSLDLAAKNSGNPEELAKGVLLIQQQMEEIYEKEGVQRIEAVGKRFDPTLHEALMAVESEQDGIIQEEYQTGYLFHGKVLRHSKVKVGRRPDEDNQGDTERETGERKQ